MPRRQVNTQELRELGESDLAFANDLVAKGLTSKASMKQVLRVLGSSEADVSSKNKQSSPSKNVESPSSSTSKKVDIMSMPRTWKEAENHASIRARMQPKSRRSPSRPKSSQTAANDIEATNGTSTKSSRKKKSLYPTARGPRREISSTVPVSTPTLKGTKNSNKMVLRDAVLRGDTSYIRTLLRNGECEVDSPDKLTGCTLLHICAHSDSVEVADILIAAGANVNYVNKNGECPLHWAASNDSAKTAQLLLDFGAEIETVDDSGATALLRTAASGSPQVLAVLLSRGGDANSTDYDGFNCVDLLEQCLAEEVEPESNIRASEGALATAMLMLRHISSSSSSRQGEAGSFEDHAAEERRLNLTQRLQKAIERRVAMQGNTDASAEQSEALSIRDETVATAARPATANRGSSATSTPFVELAVDSALRNEFQLAISATIEVIQSALENVENRLSIARGERDQVIEENHNRHGALHSETSVSKGSTATEAETSAKKQFTSKKDVRSPLQSSGRNGAVGRKYGPSFKLGDAAISPARRRVTVKYSPAQYVPFLPNPKSARAGDVLVAIEQCTDCEKHQWNLRHDAKRYLNAADRCLIAVVRELMEKRLPVRVFAYKDVPSHTRLGALEVTISVRNAVGAPKPWTTYTAFSKLDSLSWPSTKRVASKARAFVKWALKEGGITKVGLNENPTAPISLSDNLDKESTKKEIQSGEDVIPEERHAPGIDEVKETKEGSLVSPSAADIERRTLSMEHQFMGWLMRLSSKGNQTAPVHSLPPALDLLGAAGAMNTPLESCRKRVARKGAFIPSYMDVALGDGGGDLTNDEFDALVMEHFFVFSALDDVDPALLGTNLISDELAKSDSNVSKDLSRTATNEGTVSGKVTEDLAIDVVSLDHAEQGKASSSVLGMDSPIFEIIPDQEIPGDEHCAASTLQNDETNNLFWEEKRDERSQAGHELLAVGTRVEGNYLGEGQWYKGVIIGISGEAYDIEYDDDEVETGVKAECVREVKRLPFHVRMKMQEAQAQEAQAQKREENAEEERKDFLSPVNQEETSRDATEDLFLQLSASEGGNDMK